MLPAAMHVCQVLEDSAISHEHILHLIFGFLSFCLRFYTDNATSLTVVGGAQAPSDSTAGLPQYPSSKG